MFVELINAATNSGVYALAINYPEFISVSFSFDLDTITLRKDKKAEDVLELL